MPKILAIETSCDETGVAVLEEKSDTIAVLASNLASQIDIHKETGGVIPEVAAREHAAVIQPLIKKTMKESALSPEQLDAIAVTIGPGLQPALAVGVTAAQTLAFAWDKPTVPVHHLEGHIYSALLQGEVKFPALALIVSGGHTMLIEITGHLAYRVLGATRDDAVGEAFDKVARMLGLGYPGGPAISKLAAHGNPAAFTFARPMIHSGDLDFSFSGLKTEVLYTLRDLQKELTGAIHADIAASFEHAAVETLVIKTIAAAKQTKPQTLLLAGGVAANTNLRQALAVAAEKLSVPLLSAPLDLCGDNAVMIGQVGLYARKHSSRLKKWRDIDATARLSIEDFTV